MQCNYCGTENPENAVFCKKCGRRLDGMSLCSACGKLTPLDGEFCINCGSNRNAPVYTMPLRFPDARNASTGMKAGKVYDNVAHLEGVKGKELAQKQDDTEPYGSEEIKLRSKMSIITDKISLICALSAALIGMIFVFLISAVQSASTGAGSVDGGPLQSIFYFFGEAYKTTGGAAGSVSTSKMIGAIIGTICSVAALAGTAVSFIITVLRLVKILRKQTGKSIFVPAAATYISYICGIALFLFCISSKTNVGGVTIGLTASGVTVAGIILGAVFLAASVVLGVISRGVRVPVGEFVLQCASKAVYAILAFVVLGLVGGGAIFLGVESVSTTYGIEAWFGLLAAMHAMNDSNSAYGVSLAVGALLFVFALAFCVFLTLAVSNAFRSVENRLNKRSQLNILISGVCALVVGILMLVGSSIYASNSGDIYSASAGIPVAVIILGALIVAGIIVYVVLNKKLAARAEGPSRIMAAEESFDGTGE